MSPAGGLLVDKPAGITSHDVVAEIRREREGKVGHAGTLDPFATGLLVVLWAGRPGCSATCSVFPRPTWPWRGWAGARRPATPMASSPRRDGSLDRLELPTGEIEQRVPMTRRSRSEGSASTARPDAARPSRPRPARHRPSRRADRERAERATFEIECSSGTYVRTLVETLEDAYCESLRRTAIAVLGAGRRSA